MTPRKQIPLLPIFSRRLMTPFALVFAFALVLFHRPAHAAESGIISGNVSNSATGNLLEGALVEVPALRLSVLTDSTGRYSFANVPGGTYEVVATYIGLDPIKSNVTVTTGQRATRDFNLTTGIYKLEAFKVTGEREGNAAMITEKKNAENVKDVIAMDSFGYLPNMSAGEVVMRLPGVAGSPTDEGLNYRFNIRGMDAALNNVTLDGGSLTTLGTNRAFELQSITGAMFDGVELIKGQTPDKGADSLGGTINFKSRPTFAMRENSRTTYNFSMRWASPFFEQTPLRKEHRAHPGINLTHQQVFNVFGGNRNLGMSANLFYSENAVGGFETVIDRTNLLNGPAPIFNYQTWDNTNNRKQQSVNFKTDYKLSPYTRIGLALMENDNFERHRRRVRVTAATGANTTVPSATTGIVPGAFNSKITVVRPLATTNTLDVQMDGPLNYYVRMGRADLSVEHNYSNLLIEYTAGVSRSTLNNGQGRGGQLNMRLYDPAAQVAGRPVVFGGAGWIIDQNKDELHPEFRQNGGPDFTNPNNYLPRATDGLTQQRNETDQLQKQFRFDTRYKAPIAWAPIFLKTGFHWRSLQLDEWAKDRHRWTPNTVNAYNPAVRFTPDTSYVSYDRVKTGRAIPIFQAEGTLTKDGRPIDPSMWTEDIYYNESQKYIGTRGAKEAIGAQYLMAQGRLGNEGWRGRTGFLGGIRFEDVKVRSWGWVRARTPSTAAQQLADPIGAATRDYANTDRVIYGKFDQKFPSIHAYHDITRNLKARVSYSTGYGRASMSNFFPGETITDTATSHTITINNPGLKPQQAKNWDTTLEYYFEPVGSLTFGWYHKEIRDFIITGRNIGIVPGGRDNGFDGDYEGFTMFTTLNAGTVMVQGWEFAYNQQFTFLPGPLKGLAATFNYSWIDQHGTQSGTRYLTRRDIANFIPMSYNAGLRWNYNKYSARALYNYTSENCISFNATNPALSQFRNSMATLNVGAGYQYTQKVGFNLDIANILNEPQSWYVGYKDRMRRTTINFVSMSLSMTGRF